MVPWRAAYLEILREDAALCLPALDLQGIADRLDIPKKTLEVRRRSAPKEFREEERKIIAEHAGRLRAERFAASFQPPEDVEKEEEGELPWALERYLELYQEHDDRMAAVRALQGEGIEISLDDVIQAMQQYPGFDRAMRELWEEGNVEAEDKLRRQARDGKMGAISMYLKGNKPEKYGNKVRVDVGVTHQLGDEDRLLVESIRENHIAAPKRKPLPEPPPEDVVEAEYSEVSERAAS